MLIKFLAKSSHKKDVHNLVDSCDLGEVGANRLLSLLGLEAKPI